MINARYLQDIGRVAWLKNYSQLGKKDHKTVGNGAKRTVGRTVFDTEFPVLVF